jgi:transcriptional regulator with XRE-family HTH domain
MDVSKLLKDLRARLGLGQTELASALGVSFATVNRWENGHFKPTPMALRALKQFCREHGIDYAQYDDATVANAELDLPLYAACSDKAFDKSELFLDSREEALDAAAVHGYFLEARLTLSSARVLTLTSAVDFLFFNAFQKKMLTEEDAPARFERYQKLSLDSDVILTYGITKDLFALLARFYRGEITDRALSACLSLYSRGQGYFLVSDRAKNALTVKLRQVKRGRSEESSTLDGTLRQYRREGYYFDEIVDTDKNPKER